MRNVIKIAFILTSINLKSQTNIVQTTEVYKNNPDSVIVKTKFETVNGKFFLQESRCRKVQLDSISEIDRRRAKKIIQDFNWKN